MDSFVGVIGRLLCGGGSSYVSSSCAGKAPAVPKKCISKAFGGKKRKCLKTTINTTDLESLTYHKSKSKSEPKPLLLHLVDEPKQIELFRQWY